MSVHTWMVVFVILLRVSGIAELSRTNPEVNDDGEGDDVWVELLPVQLVDPYRARLLQGKKEKKVASQSPATNTRIWHNAHNTVHLSSCVTNQGSDLAGSKHTTTTKLCQWRLAKFWRAYQGGDWQATRPQLPPKSQFACQAFYEIRRRGCSVRRDEAHGRWLGLTLTSAALACHGLNTDVDSRARGRQPTLILPLKRHNQVWLAWWKAWWLPRLHSQHKYVANTNL